MGGDNKEVEALATMPNGSFAWAVTTMQRLQ
jgi:hypothetical protein